MILKTRSKGQKLIQKVGERLCFRDLPPLSLVLCVHLGSRGGMVEKTGEPINAVLKPHHLFQYNSKNDAIKSDNTLAFTQKFLVKP